MQVSSRTCEIGNHESRFAVGCIRVDGVEDMCEQCIEVDNVDCIDR
jgi:hypothetical protein